MAETQIVPITVTLKHRGKFTVPDVEVDVCTQCGDRIFSAEALRKIEDYKQCTGRLLLRLEPTLHAELLRHARAAHRSLNQEITYLLSTGLKKAS
ncbi:MAG: toxin-antitoxin system HicB family antitoxin [Deltaproteobacteria bacterium]|nr:toxin-antitoxin system HicB family antitoxin [Deltaproteobacteria bacterium]